MDSVPLSEVHEHQRFNRLAQQANLVEFLSAYEHRGYRFVLLTVPLAPSATHPASKLIIISGNELIHPIYSEEVLFLINLMHELGHCEAYERGLDHNNELLAWIIAENICPVPCPPEWSDVKALYLASYGIEP